MVTERMEVNAKSLGARRACTRARRRRVPASVIAWLATRAGGRDVGPDDSSAALSPRSTSCTRRGSADSSEDRERVGRRADAAGDAQRGAREAELVDLLAGAVVGERVEVEELAERDTEVRQDPGVGGCRRPPAGGEAGRDGGTARPPGCRPPTPRRRDPSTTRRSPRPARAPGCARSVNDWLSAESCSRAAWSRVRYQLTHPTRTQQMSPSRNSTTLRGPRSRRAAPASPRTARRRGCSPGGPRRAAPPARRCPAPPSQDPRAGVDLLRRCARRRTRGSSGRSARNPSHWVDACGKKLSSRSSRALSRRWKTSWRIAWRPKNGGEGTSRAGRAGG